ncbi:Protein OCTR-1 a [Aphelenchoides avenae]|nr:Protein OCTR-1 a [Aphelenchus avenae]
MQRHNWLIVSLAAGDLQVGLLMMPLTKTYAIIGAWALGNIPCELWLAMDVLFVTASILHICVISLDRHWTVTWPLTYPARRTALKIWMMIVPSTSNTDLRSILRSSVDLTKTKAQKDRPKISLGREIGNMPLRFMDSDAKPIDDDTLDALEGARIHRENKRSEEKRRKPLKLRKRQSTLLLGIILGAFWLPFFTVYVLGALGYQAPGP